MTTVATRPAGQSQDDIADGLREIRARTAVPGISVVASFDGVRVSSHCGVADLETASPLTEASRFEMSCLMKFLVSVLAQKLRHRGVVSLSEPLSTWLPELSGSFAGQRITLGHLLSHTSGYRGLDVSDARVKWGQSWERLIEQLRCEPLLFPPGSVFSYEHSEHVLAGEILVRATGRSLRELLDQEILDPLGIVVGNARQDRRDDSFVSQHVPAGMHKFTNTRQPAFSEFWRASLPDMTVRLQDVLAVGEWILQEGNESLNAALGNQVIELPHQYASSGLAELVPASFGHVCGKYESGLLGHNGSTVGQTIALRIDAGRRSVYVVGLNAWVPHARDAAIRLMSGDAPPLREPDPDDGSTQGSLVAEQMFAEFSFSDLVGTYDGGFASQITIDAQGDDSLQMLVGAPGPRQRRIVVERRKEGGYEFCGNLSLSCAFSAHPVDQSPVLHLGVHTYRRRP